MLMTSTDRPVAVMQYEIALRCGAWRSCNLNSLNTCWRTRWRCCCIICLMSGNACCMPRCGTPALLITAALTLTPEDLQLGGPRPCDLLPVD